MKTIYQIRLRLLQTTKASRIIRTILIKSYNLYAASEKKHIGIINICVHKTGIINYIQGSPFYVILNKSINSKSLLDDSFNVTCKLKILI